MDIGGVWYTRPSQSSFFHFHAVFGKNMPNNRFSPHRLGNPGSALVMGPYVATSSFFISRNGDVVDIPSFCTSHKTTFRNPDKESADCRLLSTRHVGGILLLIRENGFHGKSPASCTVPYAHSSNIRDANGLCDVVLYMSQ